MKADFIQYNTELINGSLIEMAMDHHRTGPRYGSSYGYSTSKREVVGKAFAMGAMVVGKYGEQADPELQKKLKSRINVASYRASKDVDLGRLRQFSDDFSYLYGRQAEVMGVGGTDADAIMIVQRLGADGLVIDTFARNPSNPKEILRLKGHWTPEEGALPMDRVMSRHEIKNGSFDASTTAAAIPQDGIVEPLVSGKAEAPKVYLQEPKKPGEANKVVQPEGVVGWLKNLIFGRK